MREERIYGGFLILVMRGLGFWGFGWVMGKGMVREAMFFGNGAMSS